MTGTRFGLSLAGLEPLQAVEDGVRAERAGFDAVWVPDHYTDVEDDKLEPWTVLSAIAPLTKKIELGLSVTDTQRSHPSRTAHAAACLDVISGGRVLMGIGAGEAMNIVPFGLPWEEPAGRADRFEEAVRLIKLLWSSSREKHVSLTGEYYRVTDAFLSLSPSRKPHPPIYVGAMSSRRMLEITGELADGWVGWFNTPELFKKKWKIIEGAAKANGRDPRRIDSVTFLLMALPTNAEERRAAVLGAKCTLLMEQRTLQSMGYSRHLDLLQYQNFTISKEYVDRIFRAAAEIPDEYVERGMAIGDFDVVREQVDALAGAGVKQIGVIDMLGAKSRKRTLGAFAKLIREYKQR